MPIPAAVLALIERFSRNIDAYKRGAYNETQVRVEYIDPLFAALGWDVHNRKGYAEAYKEVVHEDAVRVGGVTKAPDYSFRIGGVRKFFLEAKKPSVDIKNDIHPAFQVRRYAWSAKLPLSVLTDFEEFAVYDCRQKPDKTDSAAVGRVMYVRYTDFAERWDEIAEIFSQEAILTGSFDKYIESHKSKRGTAEVDAAFLQEIERWRELLARNIALRNPAIGQRELNFAVQQTIDRLIFLRICEDRGVEAYATLMGLQNGTQVYARLVERFRQADARYNSGLFHFDEEKGREGHPDRLTPGLTIDDKVLKDILKNLYYPDSPYEFSVLPADILGQVYEQFLGKVIRLTAGHQAKVEEKPEVRKAGGVYYTPTYIVDYIVQQTVGKLVEGKRPGPRGGVSRLRIVDPACGSGSFLIGAYQFLLDWHLAQYLADGPEQWADKSNPQLYRTERGEWRLTIDERKRILLNNLYGVDIDPQAVEVTKLSLLLKVLEGESEQTLNPQLELLPDRVLPDLAHNIRCGNSLIGPDFYEGQQLALLDEEESYRLNVFEWEAAFPEVFAEGGFDGVIGNPPYGASFSPNEIAFLLRQFPVQSYQMDSYLLFLEKGFSLLQANGMLGFIIPNTWLLNLTGAKFRQHIFETIRVEEIVHYGRSVFPKVTVDTETVVFSNQPADDKHEIVIGVISKDGQLETYRTVQHLWRKRDGAPINLFERPEFYPIADKLRAMPKFDGALKITQGTKPFQTGKGKPPQTKEIVAQKPFVADAKIDGTFRPLLRGSLMQRYRILWNDNYYISFGDWLAEPRYSAGYDAPEKLVVRQTGDSLIATLDEQQFIARDNLYTIVPRELSIKLHYVLGVLNSKLLNWFYQNILNPEKGEALAQVKRGHLAELPIKIPDFSDPADAARHDRMVALVQRMLDLHKQLAAATLPHSVELLQRQIDATDRQIDGLVYELYRLSEEEIRIVEGRG
jgi:hypothetical protein